MLLRTLLGIGLFAATALPASAQELPDLLGASETPTRVPKFQPRIAPLDIGVGDGFAALVFTPPLDGAYTLGPGRGTVFTRLGMSRTHIGQLDDPYHFHGILREMRVTGSLGLPGFGTPAELRVGFAVAAMGGPPDGITGTFRGAPILPNGWSESPQLSRGWLALKLRILDLDDPNLQVATSGWAKMPIDGDKNLTDTGEVELGAMLHVSYSIRVPYDRTGPPNVFFHLMAGGMYRGAQRALDTRVRPQPGAVFGAAMLVRFGSTPLALAVQFTGQVNPWREIAGYSRDPLAFQVGVRAWMAPGIFYEGGVSFGLADTASADWSAVLATGIVF